MSKTKTAIVSAAFGTALAGGAYGVWQVAVAIMSANPMTQFLIALGALAAGGLATYGSIRGD